MPATTGPRALAVSALLAACSAACAPARAVASLPPPSLPPPAPSLLVDPADLDRPPREVSAAEATGDLDVALRIFDEAYAGVADLPRAPSPEAIAGERARLAARARWSPADLATELGALFPFPDGHLAFNYGGPSPIEPARALDGAPPRLAPPADRRPVRFTRGAVPVLAVRSFDSAHAPALADLPAIAARLRRAPAFVVDVRGNGGGNYAFAEAFVLALTDASLARLDEREVRSLAAAEGRENQVLRKLATEPVAPAARPTFAAQLGWLDAEIAAQRAHAHDRAELVTRGAFVQGRAPGPLRAHAVFLVDRGCASACEMMLALARQIPGVVVAGDRTRGGMSAGELALFRLPSSGITVSLGTRGYADPLGDFAEIRGFLPDVWLGGDDPLGDAVRLARGPLPAPVRSARAPERRPQSILAEASRAR